jgi:membrane protease YdiL (CAAX protease family)
VDAAKAEESWKAMSLDPAAVFFGPILWFGLITHLLAMTIAVPMIEEVFNRSVLLRSFHRPRQTLIAGFQFLVDMPVIGDWLMHTKWGEKASRREGILRNEFQRIELGQLTTFGVLFSSIIFALVHHPADWLGSLICGVVWCLVLAATRKQGLGPIIWSHALTNLFLWGYVVYAEAWQFI